MISNEQIRKYLSSLKAHTMTSARNNQRYKVPLIIENNFNTEHCATHDEKSDMVNTDASKKYININNVDKYRFNGKWFTYHYSVDKPEETFGILQVDNLPLGTITDRINKKSFISRLDKLVFQKLIEPFMLFIDHKFVSWDNIDIVYDCDDTWLLIRGEKYNYFDLANKVIDLVILPFTCEFIGEEPDWLFNLNYNAFAEYLQQTSYIKSSGEFSIKSPTLDTEYEYNHMMFNVGGWVYSQIKRYSLGLLSEDRVSKLRSFIVYKNIRNDYGVIIDTLTTRYNALDKDVPTNDLLYRNLYYMPLEEYYNYPMIRFDSDGLQNDDGEYKIVITSDSIIYKQLKSSEDKILYNLSDINNLLFRENYLIFENGLFSPAYPIMTSINNITFCDNPEHNEVNIKVLYNKSTDHVIRNTDKFIRSYMNEQARIYLQILYHTNYAKREGLDGITVDYRVIRDLDAINMTPTVDDGFITSEDKVYVLTPENDSIEILRRTTPIAEVIGSDKIFKNIEAYYLDSEFAYVPKMTDYVVYINDYQNDAIGLIERAIDPLDFEFNRDNLYEENTKNAIDAIVDYDPSLLNPLYHTFVDSRVFTGTQANESLIYQFMYENRRGIKIPRKRYSNHETYVMVFVNGELIENYYRMIAYANFFFIPVDDGFEFEDSDRIEVLFFKNVNNNEIQFRVDKTYRSDQYFGTMVGAEGTSFFNLLAQDIMSGEFFTLSIEGLQNNPEDLSFYNMDVFRPFIRPKELCIFSFYPKYMLHYPTLITNPEMGRAFNISYRDSNNQLCIKGDGIRHIIQDETFDEFTKEDQKITKYLVATSKHKFIYQRLYVDQKSYRIKIDSRFRFCDNQRQYLLFINGRRMKQDSYLVTIPKHTRPFTDIYLYTARFVNPEDRVEIFYLPYPMDDININDTYKINENGYLSFDKTKLKVPFSKDLYVFFVNGKKIPITDVADINSNTVRITVDTNSMKHAAITSICVDSIPEVEAYMQDEYRISKYDSIVNYIKTHDRNPYKILDTVFGYSTTMSDGESDMIWANVAKIAILNEIVRDFWVTSGYPYQDALFVYDYDKDELYEKTDDDILILPALDANPEINIEKNEVSLLYFYTDPQNLLYEFGDRATSFKFFWEYSQRLNQGWKILSQNLNGIELGVNDREYEWNENITTSRKFTLTANTGHDILVHDTYLDFVNGLYWGTIDEDELQYYRRKNAIQSMNEIFAVIPKNGIIPSSLEQKITTDNAKYNERIPDDNYIVRGLDYDIISTHIGDPYAPAIDYRGPFTGFIAVRAEDGHVFDDIFAINLNSGEHIYPLSYAEIIDHSDDEPSYGYYDENDLPTIINRLDKHLVRTPNVKLNDYIIGNNNYFVFACPKRYVYDFEGHWQAEFYLPDPNNEDIVNHCRDDKTTPVYTNGDFDKLTKTLVKLDKMDMVYMGECKFTNDFGYTEQYCVWKANGFFTRLFENYGIDIHCKIGDFSNTSTNYTNNTEVATIINYINGIEYKEIDDIDTSIEHTKNMEEEETETVDTAGTANTLPKSNAASIQKTSAKIIHTQSNEPAALGNIKTVDIGANVDDDKIKEFLDQGIFLI